MWNLQHLRYGTQDLKGLAFVYHKSVATKNESAYNNSAQMNFIKCFLLVVVLMACFINVKAQNIVPDNVERAALQAIYDNTSGATWTAGRRWTLGQINSYPDSALYGVEVENGDITSISLNSAGLNGSLPSELNNLIALQYLIMPYNYSLRGELPDLSSLQKLKTLSLSNSDFSGTFPLWLCNLKALVNLDLTSYSGTDTQITGPLPAEISNLDKLQTFSFNYNDLSQRESIPSSFSSLSSLLNVSLSGCKLQPTSVSTGLSGLPNLYMADLSHNPDFVTNDGVFPDVLFNLPALQYLVLVRDNFQRLPASFNELPRLSYLNLSSNNYSDTTRLAQIVDTLSTCLSLKTLVLSDCQIVGLPSNFNTLSTVQELQIQYNYSLDPARCKEIGQMPALKNLYLFSCNLTDLPLNLYQSQTLEFLYAPFNKLYPIPEQLKQIPNLKQLNLSYNGIQALPNWFGDGNMSTLTYLSLSHNLITLPLPDNFQALINLTDLDLSFNNLEGALPSYFSKFNKMNSFNVSYNTLNSPLPNLSTWQSVSYFYVQHNNFTGAFPSYFSTSDYTKYTFDISFNHFDEFTPFSYQYAYILNFSINNNKFEFFDVLKQTASLGTYNYYSQDSVDQTLSIDVTAGDVLPLKAAIDTAASLHCKFQWFKYLNGVTSAMTTIPLESERVHTITFVDAADNGARYFYKITNDARPNLTLTSRYRTLNVSGSNPVIETGECRSTLADEYHALMALYQSTNSEGWTNSLGWKTTNPNEVQSIQGWTGITTDAQGFVTRLSLSANNLVGEIPQEIGKLCKVRGLELRNNHLSGNIPSAIGDLKELRQLDMSSNEFTGTLPASFGNLVNLVAVSIEECPLLGGAIPSLGRLNKLIALSFSHCNFSGPIPTDIGRITSLITLLLDANQLSGTIPSEIGELRALQNLSLGNNKFTGTIPAEIGSLSKLTWLDLSTNRLTGSIPEEFGRLKKLYALLLADNILSGTLPEWDSLTELKVLLLSRNKFTGDIPLSWNSLNVSVLAIDSNELSGVVAAGPFLSNATIQNNRFTFASFLDILKGRYRPRYFQYAPQDSVDVKATIQILSGTSHKLTANIDRKTSTPSLYQWFKIENGVGVPVTPADSSGYTYTMPSVTSADSGTKYYYQITNPDARQLTLISRLQTIVVGTCAAPPVKSLFFSTIKYWCAMKFTPHVQYFPLCSTQSYLWNFGDRTTSIDRNPIHSYGSGGTYDVSLQLKYSSGICFGDTTIHQSVTYDPSEGIVMDSLIQVTTDRKPKVISSTAVTFSDVWPLTQDNNALNDQNSFMNGSRGVWRNDASYAYNVPRIPNTASSTTSISTDGVFDLQQFNWPGAEYELIPNWIKANTMTLYSPYSYELENKDVLGVYSAALYDYGGHLPSANGVNMRNAEMAFTSFEYLNGKASGNWIFGNQALPNTTTYDVYSGWDNIAIVKASVAQLANVKKADVMGSQRISFLSHRRMVVEDDELICLQPYPQNPDWSIVVFRQAPVTTMWTGSITIKNILQPVISPDIDSTFAHSGRSSLKATVDKVFSQDLLKLDSSKSYFISAWVSVNNVNVPTPKLADNLGIEVIIKNKDLKVVSTFTFQPTGKIIEGWQQVRGTFTCPVKNALVSLTFKSGSGGVAWYDDLRLHPEKGNMRSYVYNLTDYRLRAILDEENFASFFYYDAEGNLYLTKKETEEGIKTITENISYQKETANGN